MGTTWSQFFPPAPTLTEANLPSQKGKVFIITGGYSGVGLALCKILYLAGGKVYLAGRSEEQATNAITQIQASIQSSDGTLIFLPLHLDDLASIKSAVETYTAAESRLDVLFNNAGVSNPPAGSVSAQGHELQLATNCLGPHLLTQLLLPTLRRTAESEPPASVRVVWTGSIVVDMAASKGGEILEELLRKDTKPQRNYEHTKVGNWYLAHALDAQERPSGILSVVVNPGNLKTGLTRHMSSLVPLLAAPLLYPAKMGAYSELWAGLSNELTLSDGGKYILPWGRLHPKPRQDLLQAMKRKADGGTDAAATFVQYCDDQILGFK
ncbi:steroid dehydrogenase [Penicillium maclennaniae]|uniref:steroid dehydrogenase n=1 Tax=Penicillium maclennaniae TaxID=1343394 RepID=UPI002541243A|nr:steroid dehydrogenase [Penicillium maclennaniae]KAJ5682043.1 steroid dehydrogenase [Penicillium maclennaniae]